MSQSRHRVLIAGGGVAGLEAELDLRDDLSLVEPRPAHARRLPSPA